MKRFKQLMMCALATLAICFMFANVTTVQAAKTEDKVAGKIYVNAATTVKGKWKNILKMRVSTFSSNSFDVDYAAGDKIDKLKVNKKGLDAKVTYKTIPSEYSTIGYSTISLYATKPGTYKVSFNVVDATGKKRGSYKMTVQAVTSTSLIKSVSFAGKTIVSRSYKNKNNQETYSYKASEKPSRSSGRLKVTLNSQYKLKNIIVVTYDKNGKYSYKKIKNGGTLNLSKGYSSKSESADGSFNKPAKKYTYICISYKDKFLGDTVTYSIVKNRGYKEVKRLSKDGQTGYKSVNQSRTDSDLTLWQY